MQWSASFLTTSTSKILPILDLHLKNTTHSRPALLRVRSLNRYSRVKLALSTSFSQSRLSGIKFSSKSINPNAISFNDLLRNKLHRHSYSYVNMAEDLRGDDAMDPNPCGERLSIGQDPSTTPVHAGNREARTTIEAVGAQVREVAGEGHQVDERGSLSYPANMGLPLRANSEVPGLQQDVTQFDNWYSRANLAEHVVGGSALDRRVRRNVLLSSEAVEVKGALGPLETSDPNGVHGHLSTRRRSSYVSEQGSPLHCTSIAKADGFQETFELIDDEEEEESLVQEDICFQLEQEAPRVRLIGNMTLREDPEAHEFIMGYKRGEGPSFAPFTNTSTPAVGNSIPKAKFPKKQPWTPPTFPPRTTSLSGLPGTPSTVGGKASVADRLSRSTAASASRAIANSARVVSGPTVVPASGSRIPRRTSPASHAAFVSLVASGNTSAPVSGGITLGSPRVVSGSAIPTPSRTATKNNAEALRRESTPAATKQSLKSRVSSLMNIRKRHRAIADEIATKAKLPGERDNEDNGTAAGIKEHRATGNDRQVRERKRDIGYMSAAHAGTNVERTIRNQRSRFSLRRRRDEDDDPNHGNNTNGGPAGHYTEAEEDAATIAAGEDDSVVLTDRFDESGVGAFFDYQIAQARRHLGSVQDSARGVSDAHKRAQLLEVVNNQLGFLNGLEHLRTANIHGNNATAALVRNLAESANSAAHSVISAL